MSRPTASPAIFRQNLNSRTLARESATTRGCPGCKLPFRVITVLAIAIGMKPWRGGQSRERALG